MRHAVLIGTILLGCVTAARAATGERYFALSIGYNGAPAAGDTEAVTPLHFADDDAVAFYELEHEAGNDAVLLTVLDPDTRRRYPQAVDIARPPTTGEIEQAVSDLNKRIDAAARSGHIPVFLFFYSGHGSRPQNAEAALALLDGTLPGSVLREHIVAKVHAQVIHLIIDACHADAIVRPRDTDAKTTTITQAEIMAQLSTEMSESYPNVGLVLASDGDNPSHEWDLYHSGVFTHEILSGLRGAADVNHDGRVEYSELAAFLNAANREVLDARARMRSILQPPSSNSRSALIDLGVAAKPGWLTNIQSSAGHFFVEDERGNRILDGHPELGFSMSVALPSDRVLFLHHGEREAELSIGPGARRRFDSLTFHKSSFRARGALESSLEGGLFLRPYGPGYYTGYIDRTDAIGVGSVSPIENPTEPTAPEVGSTKGRFLVWGLRGASAAFLGSSIAFGALAWSARSNFEAASTQVAASQADDRFRVDSTLALTFLGSGVVCAAISYFIDQHR